MHGAEFSASIRSGRRGRQSWLSTFLSNEIMWRKVHVVVLRLLVVESLEWNECEPDQFLILHQTELDRPLFQLIDILLRFHGLKANQRRFIFNPLYLYRLSSIPHDIFTTHPISDKISYIFPSTVSFTWCLKFRFFQSSSRRNPKPTSTTLLTSGTFFYFLLPPLFS